VTKVGASTIIRRALATANEVLVLNEVLFDGWQVRRAPLDGKDAVVVSETKGYSPKLLETDGTYVTYGAADSNGTVDIGVTELATNRVVIRTISEGGGAAVLGNTLYTGGAKLRAYTLGAADLDPKIVEEGPEVLDVAADGQSVFFVRGADTLRLTPGAAAVRLGQAMSRLTPRADGFVYGTRGQDPSRQEVFRQPKAGGAETLVAVFELDSRLSARQIVFGENVVYGLAGQKIREVRTTP
jgi:hypothetical protein